MNTDTKTLQELRSKLKGAVMELLEECNHQRRITSKELSDRICKVDHRFTEQDVLRALKRMAYDPKFAAYLDRIIIS